MYKLKIDLQVVPVFFMVTSAAEFKLSKRKSGKSTFLVSQVIISIGDWNFRSSGQFSANSMTDQLNNNNRKQNKWINKKIIRPK